MGLKGSSFLICSRTRSVSCELDAGHGAGALPLDLEAALEPEELFEDQTELRGRAEVVQDPDRRSGGEGKCASRTASVRDGNLRCVRMSLGQAIFQFRDLLQNAMEQYPQDARVDLARRFIDGDDPADMERRIALFVVAAEELRFRMHHLQVAALGIELDLAEQRDARAGRQPVGQISPVEPLAEQDGAATRR